ncbi:PREDICTED: transcription initiation factor TFIID subunit 3-like [Bactrocera latifrons]|uniref:transcription initiation factor TFIID subunit 3-like n=1 Tax=Bactrocera latifrons TaxID=174628 RepID=UPI0008DE0AEE|nr:PREDICTED: transcription initiation factor TFIID subunit 3-like [Bactrocera latifrons]
MGPKKRLITAAAAAAGATTTERQQRSSSNPVASAKKRPTPGKAHSSPVARKPIAVVSNTTTVKRSTHGRTPSPAKKQQTVVSKEHEKVKEAEKDNKLEKTEIESKVSENLDTNQGEVVKDISNVEGAEESLAKDQLKIKLEQPEDSARNVEHSIKSAKRTPSRENVKKSNTSETKEKSSYTTNKKVESEKQKADSEPPSTSATSANSNKSKVEDRKDGKNKAISKMLKSLDIQISGFDNILPSEERIQDTLKSSISENVKTKSRAAAVKVIANLNPPKSNIARIKARQEEDKKEKAKEKEKDKDKDKEKDKDKYKEKGKDKSKEKEKEKAEENHSKCKETEKIIEAAEVPYIRLCQRRYYEEQRISSGSQ